MALLGLGGRGLRERLIRQYQILPPGSIGQTLFDEIIPVVIVDDLTSGLVLDAAYRAPAMTGTIRTPTALENGFVSIAAPVSGTLILVEKVEFRTGNAAAVTLRVGEVPSGTGSSVFWRDRRLTGKPSGSVRSGTRVGEQGSRVQLLRGVAASFTSIDLQIVLTPSNDQLESTLTVWNGLVNDQLEVNWFWRELLGS